MIFSKRSPVINIPTTLLSQIELLLVERQINTKYGKNLIGTLSAEVSYGIVFKTLPKREIICGYEEILKHSLISKKIFKF